MPERKRAGRTTHTVRLVLGVAFCLIPASAEAHTALQGVGSFWSGVVHLLTSLDQLGFLLGLAIWTGRAVAVASTTGLSAIATVRLGRNIVCRCPTMPLP